MIRIFLSEQDVIGNGSLKIANPGSVKHLKVLRPNPGEPVQVLDGKGRVIYCRFVSFFHHMAIVRIEGEELINPPRPYVILCCPVVPQSRFDLIIGHITEFGIDEIVPMVTARSNIKALSDSKLNRWRRICVEVSKQCGNPFLPRINSLMLFEEAIAYCKSKADLLYIAGLKYKGGKHLLDCLLGGSGGGDFAMFIGPEGDFTEQELILAGRNEAVGVSLGGNVLRVETAVSCFCSFVSYLKFCAVRAGNE